MKQLFDFKSMMQRDITKDDINKAKHFVYLILLKVILSLACALLCVQSFYLSMNAYSPFEIVIFKEYYNNYYYEKTFWLLFLLFLTIAMFCRQMPIVVGSVFFLFELIAVINYYELSFRGTVFTWRDVYNTGTALSVLDNYKFELTFESQFIVLSAGIIIIIAVLLTSKNISFSRNYLLAAVCFILLVSSGYHVYAVENVDPWSWEELFYEKGYIVGSIEYLRNGNITIREPEGYSASKLHMQEGMLGKSPDYPDIIMILNEAYYDMQHLISFDTDADYMENYKKLQAIKGFASVPMVGGGTNDSEYELLTSNSISLLNNYSPFSNLDFKNYNSIIKYLESLGYATMAAHPESPGNYHRGSVWKELGFDETYFVDDFSNI